MPEGVPGLKTVQKNRKLQNFADFCGERCKDRRRGNFLYPGRRSQPSEGQHLHADADRIVAGTYLFAAAATRGEICLEGMRPSDMESVLDVLGRMGAVYENREDGFYLDGRKAINPLPVVCTETYPGFPTDLLVQLLATLCVARGRSVIRECIFEERFLNCTVAEPDGGGCDHRRQGSCDRRKGTSVRTDGESPGAARRCGTCDRCSDGTGDHRAYGSAFIERGYEDLAGDLRKLGAVISKKKQKGETVKNKKKNRRKQRRKVGS